MKRIYLLFVILVGLTISCNKGFEDMNTDDKHPTDVPAAFIFANAQKALADQEASANVNLNIWKLVSQYWTETTYTDESNYDIINRNIPDNTYRTYYRDVLIDLKEAKLKITEEVTAGAIAEAEKQNRLHIIDLLEVYCYNSLVDIFGNIPYTQALDIENLAPVYDDAWSIYQDLLTRAQAAANGLDVTNGSFGSSDLYFGGDVAMWKAFGHSLVVKMAINVADHDNTVAKQYIEANYDKVFGAGEACQLVYEAGTNSNPIYQDLVQSGRHDFVPANTIVDMMNELNDPRIQSYFAPMEFDYDVNAQGAKIDTELPGEGKMILIYQNILGEDSLVQVDLPYVALAADSLHPFMYNIGGIYGESNSFSQYSHVADAIQEETYPVTLLDYTEVMFYLAEAAARGYSVGSAADVYYNNAVQASFDTWGAGSASGYLSDPAVAYDAAQWKQRIGTQAWIAFYVRGLTGWTSWRRLDQPALNLPPAPETDDGQVPKRFTYPVNEQTLNKANRAAAAAAIGGDKMSVKLFWDKN